MGEVTLFVCGDVMTARGIDRILPHPGDPVLHEGYVKNAIGYIELAEEANGPIPRPVGFDYIWGDALEALRAFRPHARIINLETSVTTSDDWIPKGINYRMSPRNVPCLTAAGIDCCVLANNHILDYGEAGLVETLDALRAAGIRTAGAGRTLEEARAPAALALPGGGRVLVFAVGMESGGVPLAWEAGESRPGVALLRDLSEDSALGLSAMIQRQRRRGDLVVLSIHWGGNWGFEVGREQVSFARMMIESGSVDVIHGHSSHHVKRLEVHRGKLILYGCGDLITDYEGIGGYESFRGDLSLMYFPTLNADSGKLAGLEMVPLRIRKLRLQRASAEETEWLAGQLRWESVEVTAEGAWKHPHPRLAPAR